MAFKKEYIVLVLVIAALSTYLFVQRSDKTHYALPDIEAIEKNDISKLTIKKGDAEKIVLQKENDKWFIAPKNYPADSGFADKMLDDITGLTLTALASESGNYSIYELDSDKKIEVEVFRADTLLRKIGIGKTASSQRHTFVMLGDDHRIFHAARNLRNTFDKTVSVLRDKVVMKIEDSITEITLVEGKKEITIVRATDPVSVDPNQEQEELQEASPGWKTAAGEPVKESEVNDIINTLSNLSCDEFIEGRKKEDFTSPAYEVSLRGMKTYTISLFEKEDSKFAALSSESDYPFHISEWKAGKIMKEPDSLIDSGGK